MASGSRVRGHSFAKFSSAISCAKTQGILDVSFVAAIGRNVSPNKREHDAISWRFVRDRKGWRVLATVSVPSGGLSAEGVGIVAIDLNADHVAVTELDRFGNPVASVSVPCPTRGKSRHQRLAAIGDAVKRVVAYARDRHKSIVAERLDFEAKKAELEQRGARYARMLSSFAHATFHAILRARAADAGVGLRTVYPAYTSVIRAVQVREAVRVVRAPGRRPVHRAAGVAARRATQPPSGRPRRLLATREESREARVVVLAAGRAAGSSAVRLTSVGMSHMSTESETVGGVAESIPKTLSRARGALCWVPGEFGGRHPVKVRFRDVPSEGVEQWPG